MTQEEIKNILELHEKWINDEKGGKRANLEGAYLYGAYLYGAYLKRTNLYGANLYGAYLYGANLEGANLEGTNLYGAYLYGAYLEGANLEGTNLYGANLNGANLEGAKDIPFIPFTCPSEGSFIGWKKVHNRLIQLLIPEDAKRISATGRKCRCDKAQVLGIVNLKNKESEDSITNTSYSPNITYEVGKMVYPDSFDENRWNECSNGIHFFINKQEAIDYN